MVKNSSTPSGTLFVIATPIGNMEDLSPRAVKTLKQVTLIAAEDTRHSKKLLQQFGIETPLTAYHNHNEEAKTPFLLQKLQNGNDIALISDAGTPNISDPGFAVLRKAREQQITITPIPGCCAFIAALSASGLASHPFTFIGFLPAKSSARCERLLHYQMQANTVVAYESSHRLHECLHDIEKTYGAHYILQVAKELTKVYEQFITGTVSEIKHWLEIDPRHSNGEFVLILPSWAKPETSISTENQHILSALLQELPLKQAVKLTAAITGYNKNKLYEMALQIKDDC